MKKRLKHYCWTPGRYEVDELFFNMFGDPATDYSGNPIGPYITVELD